MANGETRGTVGSEDFLGDLQHDFLDESSQLLDRINDSLTLLDGWVRGLDDDAPRRGDSDLLNDMFRAAHSIKGLSAMLGLSDINRLTTKIENVFAAARSGALEITPETVELMFDALDALTQHIDQVRGTSDATFDNAHLMQRISKLLDETGAELATVTSSASGAVAAETVEPASASDVSEDFDPDAELVAKFLPLYIDETEQTLDQITESLLELEAQPRPELVERLLVAAHRLKGSSASMGLNGCAQMAHAMEDVLQAIGETQITSDAPLIEALMRCADALRAFVSGLRGGRRDEKHFQPVLQGLRAAFTDAGKRAAEPATDEPAKTEPKKVEAAKVSAAEPIESTNTPAEVKPSGEAPPDWAQPMIALLPPGATAVAGKAWFPAGMPLPGLKASLILERLGSLGKVFYSNPAVAELDRLNELSSFAFGLLTPASAPTIASRLKLGGVTKVELVHIARPEEPPAPRKPAPSANQPRRRTRSTAKKSEAEQPEAAQPASSDIPAPQQPAEHSQPVVNEMPAEVGSDTPNGLAAHGGMVATSPERDQPSAARSVKPGETLRVEIERLDQLLNLTGQLAMNKAKIAQIGQTLRGSMGRKRRISWNTIQGLLRQLSKASQQRGSRGVAANLAQHAQRLQNELQLVERELETLNVVRQVTGELNDAVHQLERIAGGIQRSVMQARMVPVGPLFNRFRRVVRDLTRITGKQIRLEISGEKTELDKRMIDELSDPLLHLVRNCADHGIESPVERLRSGKPAEGTVTFNAYYRGNRILIEVKDDGRGLDINRIRAKAVHKGLISAAEADRLTPQQLSQFIWEPGFSTAAEVTEVSGRGIGMDIVRAKVEELGGNVSLESHPGEGTVFMIRLPLTVAILPCLLVEIDGQTYAMPIESVQEIVGVRTQQLITIHGHKATVVRDRVVPVVELRELFAPGKSAAPPANSSAQRDAALVLMGEAGKEFGLRVDRLLGEADVVVQSLAVNYRHIPGIAGASVLGDGRVSLILDVNALVEAAAGPAPPLGT